MAGLLALTFIAILFAITVAVWLRADKHSSTPGTVGWVGLIVFILCYFWAFVIVGVTYDTNLKLTGYYNKVAKPAAVYEDTTTLYVRKDLVTAVWQAGDHNLSSHNTELYSYRQWSQSPVVGWFYYPLSPELKYVQIGK